MTELALKYEKDNLNNLNINKLINDNKWTVVSTSSSKGLNLATKHTEFIHTVIQDTRNISQDIYLELESIAYKCGKLQNYAYSSLSGIKNYLVVNNHKKFNKEVRDKWVKNKQFDSWGLQGRQSKEALRVCEGTIKSNWSNTIRKVRESITKKKSLTENEKKYCYSILKDKNLFFSVLNKLPYKEPDYLMKLGIDSNKLNKLIRRLVRDCKGKIPYVSGCKTISMDSNMYKYIHENNKLYIEVMGLTPFKRLKLEVKDNQRHKGTIVLVLDKTTRTVRIHAPSKITKGKDKFYYFPLTLEVGLDVGIRHLITTSNGNFYGEINNILTVQTEYQNDKLKKRNKIYNQINKLEETGLEEDYLKAEIIRKNNFGRIKWNRQQAKYKEHIKSEINHAIYELIEIEKPAEFILEKLNFQSWYKRLNSKVKRKLVRWMKGYLNKRLNEISRLYGIKITYINPAYTSQECSCCGKIGVRNGDYFHCNHCGYKDNADKNAAKVIKERKRDTEITVNTSYKEVKKIIENR